MNNTDKSDNTETCPTTPRLAAQHSDSHYDTHTHSITLITSQHTHIAQNTQTSSITNRHVLPYRDMPHNLQTFSTLPTIVSQYKDILDNTQIKNHKDVLHSTQTCLITFRLTLWQPGVPYILHIYPATLSLATEYIYMSVPHNIYTHAFQHMDTPTIHKHFTQHRLTPRNGIIMHNYSQLRSTLQNKDSPPILSTQF